MMLAAQLGFMAGKPYDAEVEFLESTGTQWIDTDTPIAYNYRIELTFATTATGSQFLFGDSISGVSLFRWAQSSTGTFRIEVGNGVAVGTPPAISTNTVYTALVNNKVCYLDGTQFGTITNSDPSTPRTEHAFLFAWNRSTILKGKARIYSCKIYDENGNAIRDYIPVRVGTVGYLYDRVSGKLFGNAGTGDFVLGPDVVPVEYIESHGTEWIKIPMDAASDCDITADFEMTTFSQSCPFGGGYGNMSSEILLLPAGTTAANSTWLYRSGNKQNLSAFTATQLTRHTMRWTHNAAEVDGTLHSNLTESGTFAANRNYMGLFCSLRNGDTTPVFVLIGRMYSAQFGNTTTTMPLLPVRVGTDSTSWEGAMMDSLTRRIYRNQGTGAFTYGNDV